MLDKLNSLQNAIDFLDAVRDTEAHYRPEGAMRDALHGLEEAARAVAKEYRKGSAITDYYTDRANGAHANRAT